MRVLNLIGVLRSWRIAPAVDPTPAVLAHDVRPYLRTPDPASALRDATCDMERLF